MATTSETTTLALTSTETSSDFSTFTSVHEATSTSYVTEFVTVTITSAVTQTSTISSTTTTVTPAKKRDAADIARRFKTKDASSATAYGEACADAPAYSSACRYLYRAFDGDDDSSQWCRRRDCRNGDHFRHHHFYGDCHDHHGSTGGSYRGCVISASDEAAAKKSMEQLTIFLEQHPEVFQKGLMRNLAYTLCQRRSYLQWKVAVTAKSASGLAEALASSDIKPVRTSQAPKIAFVYTGQGAQWHAMGRKLLSRYKFFSDVVQAADVCLKRLDADFSLLEELSRGKATSQVGKAHISQPICSAVQLCLTELLKSWGVTPVAVTDHSSGEIGAAYAAGALSPDSAMAIAYFRGQAVIKMKQRYPDLKGSMMAVGAGPDDLRQLVAQIRNGTAVVARENSPSSVTISGDEAAIDELAIEMGNRQLFNRKLKVDVAYHSQHMKLVADDYRESIKEVDPQPGSPVHSYSSLHGKKVELSTLDASYWVDNLTCPVRFSTSLQELCLSSPPDVIVEIGPHAALEGPVKQSLKQLGQQVKKIAYSSALTRNENPITTTLQLAANLYSKGQSLRFAHMNLEEEERDRPQLISDLIPYPWSRQRYWSESRLSVQHRQKPFPRHGLLGSMADFSNELAPTWRNVLRTDDIPWLKDHQMQSLVTFPFAGFVSMAVEAAAQRAKLRGVEFERFSLREIQVKKPLLMEDESAYEGILSMSPFPEVTRSYSDDWDEFRIWSWEQGKGWMEHCRGLIAANKGGKANLVSSAHRGIASRRYHAGDKMCQEDVNVSAFYDDLTEKGAIYGPAFRKLESIRASDGYSMAKFDVADTTATMPMEYQTPYYVHPTLLDQAFDKVFHSDVADMDFSEKDGRLVVPPIIEDTEMNDFVHRELHSSSPYLQDFSHEARRLKMAIGTTGALETLLFRNEETYPLGEHEIEIRVEATGMSFKDVVIAMGQLPSPYIGIECAGTVSRVGSVVTRLAVGDRVCAMSQGAYSTFARCPDTSAARIPAAMSFEVASSIPVVYCTAYYGLVDLGRLCEGERVLIHAAAGGVEQAAIQLARMLGAEIYATPRHLLRARRPGATGGAGVDMVLNSLAGYFLRETWDCVAHFGRLFEIGKRDITANTRLEMARFDHNATFSSVDLTVLARERPRQMGEIFSKVMDLFGGGAVRPIAPITVFGISEVEKAFRLLQSGKTTGKLVVVPRPGDQVRATHLKNRSDIFRAKATYIIISGTGGLGRSMTRWMVDKGAINIVLLSRTGLVQGRVASLVQEMEQASANIIVKACDVSSKDSVAELTSFCTEKLPPIAGVIHAGMVLRDVLFEKMTFDDYEAVIRSKVAGAWNMHSALLETALDFFIVISSAAGIVGNRGQAAYAAANTFLDAFVRYRMRLGLAAAALDLTAVEDVGYLADNAARRDDVLRNLGGQSMNEAEVLALVMAAVQGRLQGSCGGHYMTGLDLGDGVNLPYFAADAKFEHLRRALPSVTALTDPTAQLFVGVALSRAQSAKDALGIVSAGLAGKLATILMVPADDLDPETSITKYGLDSLNAIELRNWITKSLEANLQVLELLASGSLTNLASIILKTRAAAKESA
ncbi:hypothetical protein LQW54_002398 [Pestalotiopsis sp. IQ-011]